MYEFVLRQKNAVLWLSLYVVSGHLCKYSYYNHKPCTAVLISRVERMLLVSPFVNLGPVLVQLPIQGPCCHEKCMVLWWFHTCMGPWRIFSLVAEVATLGKFCNLHNSKMAAIGRWQNITFLSVNVETSVMPLFLHIFYIRNRILGIDFVSQGQLKHQMES